MNSACGDFRINLHDRFSLSDDPADEIQLSNVVNYGRFENTAGVSVIWDLNKAVLTFGYDHYTYISTTDTFSYLDRNAEILSFSAYFALTSTTGGGIETAAVSGLLVAEARLVTGACTCSCCS